eukprot:IDg22992t1
MLEDKVQVVALGDTGSDLSALPSSIFEIVIKAEPGVVSKVLATPMKFQTAIAQTACQELKFTASRTATIAVTIILPGSNISVRIRGVELAIVDQEMDEILLGRPFLKAIGFDLNEHFQRVHSEVHDKHFEELKNSSAKIASTAYKGMVYQEVEDDPIQLPDVVSAGIGNDSDKEIDEAFNGMLKEALKNGISQSGHTCLKSLLAKYRSVFSIKLGPSPPAKISSLAIVPAPDARLFRSSQRRFSPGARDFIIKTIHELESVGAVFKNPASRWASPALAVPKPGSTKIRFTVDLRRPNAMTIPIQSAIPHLESRFQDTEGRKRFASIDMTHGYWQISLD